MPTTHYCTQCLTTFHGEPTSCPNLSCSGAKPPGGWGEVLQAGDVLDRHYHIVRPLAVGGAGLCYLAQELDAHDVPQPPDLAIKVLYAQRDQGPFLQRLANEAQILRQLDHPHIVQSKGFVQRAGHPPYLVTLFERGGPLSAHIARHGPLPVTVCAGIARQIVLALDVAHGHGVVHRDLKPENVLLREGVLRADTPHIRLVDFGIAKVHGAAQPITRAGAFVGTPEYAAPEQFESQPATPSTDLYAVGGILWFTLTGTAPVAFDNRADLAQSYDTLLSSLPKQLPEGLARGAQRDVLQRVLDHTLRAQASTRWTAAQLLLQLDALIDGGHDALSQASRAVSPPEPEEVRAEPSHMLPLLLGVLGLGTLVALAGGAALLAVFILGWPTVPIDPNESESTRLTRLLSEAAAEATTRCGLSAPTVLELTVDARGTVTQAKGTGGPELPCLRGALLDEVLPRTEAGDVHLTIRLRPGGDLSQGDGGG